MFPLTVYKASAGSGKTFTLASQYIRLLVENPQQYRNILAVTFTNKATDEMKRRLLGVDAEVLAEHGAVSREVAIQMAEKAREKVGTDLALSLTGLAGPGDDGVHTVGTVFVALAAPEATYVRRLYKDKWGRERIKHAAANHAFDMLRRYLDGLPVEYEENC